jgi:hypothetical protein
MEKKTLTINEPLSPVDFLKYLDFSEENEILDETNPGEWLDQIVPSIYFRQNEFFRIDFNSAIQGMLLNIISTKKNVSINLEFHETPFIKYYDAADNKFSPLIIIERSSLIKYEKLNSVHFMGVKPKKSLKMMSNLRGAPIGGLIPSLIFRGAFKLAAKAEDDLVEKEGTLFELYFLENSIEKKIDIIVDSFYVEQFEMFLKTNWKKIAPPKTVEEKKEGCFIATACYNDYDHPIVYQLRNFRDYFLNEKKWGRKFISIYYKHSPRCAKMIESNNFMKYFFKIALIKPLYYLTKFLNLEK